METCIVTFMSFFHYWRGMEKKKKIVQKLEKIVSSWNYYSERNVDRTELHHGELDGAKFQDAQEFPEQVYYQCGSESR